MEELNFTLKQRRVAHVRTYDFDFQQFDVVSNQPQNLSATLLPGAPVRLRLEWTQGDDSQAGYGFHVYRIVGQTKELIAELPLSTTAYEDAGFPVNGWATYEVVEYSAGSESYPAVVRVAFPCAQENQGAWDWKYKVPHRTRVEAVAHAEAHKRWPRKVAGEWQETPEVRSWSSTGTQYEIKMTEYTHLLEAVSIRCVTPSGNIKTGALVHELQGAEAQGRRLPGEFVRVRVEPCRATAKAHIPGGTSGYAHDVAPFDRKVVIEQLKRVVRIEKM